MVKLDAAKKSTREINAFLKEISEKGGEVHISNPAARHNLGVCILKPCKVVFEGSVGYYCASMLEGPDIVVKGNAGWGFGEHLYAGSIRLTQNASLAAGASMKGGDLVIEGDAGSRAGISMKGGLMIIGGNSGYLTGFIMQKGHMIICGDVGDAAGDSMYEGLIHVAGNVASVGTDAQVKEATPEEIQFIRKNLERLNVKEPKNAKWKTISSRRTLYHFDKLELKDRHVV
jgi:methylamine---glutamate N-methyltransferase subunit B